MIIQVFKKVQENGKSVFYLSDFISTNNQLVFLIKNIWLLLFETLTFFYIIFIINNHN